MYDSEDSIGVEATDYLLDLGFDCGPSIEYVGDCIIDQKIMEDDSHPEHSEMLNEYIENSMNVCNGILASMYWLFGGLMLKLYLIPMTSRQKSSLPSRSFLILAKK